MHFEHPKGATPLDPDEIEGLIPSHITTQQQLNEWEEANILNAENWLPSKLTSPDFLTIDFMKMLHEKMFNQTWKWAGTFRKSEKSIGIAPYQIATQLSELLDNIIVQIAYESYSLDEIAYRLHHRLVFIHLFPNGNGRHARLMTDFLLMRSGQPRFTWGRINLTSESITRNQYIDALKAADKHDYAPLAAFVRS